MAPVFCVVAAANLRGILDRFDRIDSKILRMDIIEKVKEFLGTTEEPM